MSTILIKSRNRVQSLPIKQRGVALITVLFLFAVAVVIMANVLQRLNQDIQAYSAYFESEQAYLYALSGEELGRQLLAQDFEESPGADHRNELWKTTTEKYEMDNGYFEIEINDLQGKFNLNNLVKDDGKRDGNNVAALISLFKILELDPDIFNAIPSQLGDWLDQTTGGKVSDSDYLSLDNPYRPANAKIAHPSEMRMLLDMDKEFYKEIKLEAFSYLTALPTRTLVNVNTVSWEVLASLHTQIKQPTAESAVAKAKSNENGFQTVEEFLQQIPNNTLTADELTVSSQYFEVRVRAKFADQYAFLTSILHRDARSGNLELISRDRSQRFVFEHSIDYKVPEIEEDREIDI